MIQCVQSQAERMEQTLSCRSRHGSLTWPALVPCRDGGARVRAYRVDSAVLCSTHLHQRRHLFRNDSKKRQHTSCFCCLEWFSNSIYISFYLVICDWTIWIKPTLSQRSFIQVFQLHPPCRFELIRRLWKGKIFMKNYQSQWSSR